MLDELPAGAHTRPEGLGESQMLVFLWEYHAQEMEPVWPIPYDPEYAEMSLRGLTSMLPGLRRYLDKLPRAVLDGGYYTRTPENRPIIGPLPLEGAYACGAFSGYGLMAACGAGEILAAYLTQTPPPPNALAFSPVRYEDPAYMEKLKSWGETGQL
jgi:glycine/D-amino acid oxidase-like deaminating enzyme